VRGPGSHSAGACRIDALVQLRGKIDCPAAVEHAAPGCAVRPRQLNQTATTGPTELHFPWQGACRLLSLCGNRVSAHGTAPKAVAAPKVLPLGRLPATPAIRYPRPMQGSHAIPASQLRPLEPLRFRRQLRLRLEHRCETFGNVGSVRSSLRAVAPLTSIAREVDASRQFRGSECIKVRDVLSPVQRPAAMPLHCDERSPRCPQSS